MFSIRLASLASIVAAVLQAQTPPPASEPPAGTVIRVSVNLVQIDAVVTDSKGRHISGLGPDDFEVFEDGKPQKITHLSYVDPTLNRAPPQSPKGSKPAEIIAAPSHKPRREEIHRAIVLLVDDIHTTGEHLVRLKPVTKKFVEEQVAPGDMVSISTVRGGMGFYEQFTSDRNILNAAVESLAKRAGGSPDPLAGVDEVGGADCLRAQMLFDAVMGKLSWAIESLHELPGRKAIVLFSDGLSIPRKVCPSQADGMTASMQRVADKSNRSGVAIYVIDSRGLVASSNADARSAAGFDEGVRSMDLQETSDFLAAETGGIFFRNTNGLSDALGKSIDDMSGYYLIGFQPQRTDFELKKGAAVYHKVGLKLRQPGYSVRYGRGFFGTPDDDNGTLSVPFTPEQQLAGAMLSPFDSGGIKVRLTPLYAAPTPGPKGERRPTVIKALLSIDTSTLRLTDQPDGNKKVVLGIVAAAYRSDNTPISTNSGEYVAILKPGELAKLADGITYQGVIGLPKSGAYQIRAAVRDSTSGALGSANSFVIVPDFSLPRIAISSVMLTGADRGDVLTEAASREFRPGVPIAYACEIYGTKGTAEIEIRLFRDGARVFASAPMTLRQSAGAKAISVVGKLSLPASMADGDYQLELVARDPAGSKKQSASQWTDLTLVTPGPMR